MQIVEINISPYLDGNIADTQARVIECESWEKYVSYFTEYNDHQLVCTIYNYKNQPTKKIACIVR